MADPDRLGFVRLAAFSSPVVLFQAIELGWRAFLPAFFVETIGLTLASAGAILFAARLFDAAADPVIGWLSDRLPTRFGFRRPWMMAGAPLVSAGALALFLAPAGAALLWIVPAALALHLGYSLIITPHGGWALELSADPHERTRIMGAKVWFAAAGSILVLLLAAMSERWLGIGRAGQVAILGVVIALLAPLSVGLVTGLFAERRRTIRPAAGNPFALVRAMARDPALVRVFALYALTGIADASAMASFLFLVDHALALRGWGASLMLIQAVMIVLALPLWSAASHRLGKERTLMIAYGWQTMMAPLALLLPVGALVPLIAFLCLRNLSSGTDYMLLRAMVSDLAEQQAAAGWRSSGSYYGLSSVTVKLAMGVGAAGALWLIGLAGSGTGVGADGAASQAIRLAYALPTTLAGAIGLLILARGRSGIGARAMVVSA